jgi:hypothetical protein
MNRRLWWIGAAGAVASVCLSASVALARYGVVHTKDGRTLEGEADETPDQVTIVIHGIRTNIARDNVQGQVQYFDNIEARYQDKLSKLPKNPTAQDRLAVARWLYDNRQYDLAQKEIDEARKIDPNSAEAAALEQTVVSQRRIDKSRPAGPGGGTPGTTPPPPRPAANSGEGGKAPPAAGGPGERPHLLTADDINTIRQMEWRENDTVPPRATVPVDVRKRYAEMRAYNAGQFSSLSQTQQAYAILSDPNTPPDMREKIRITSDPQALADYRRAVQPLVLNNCATAGCHGAKGAGDFMLYTNNSEREDVAYTNFYILQSYASKNGEHLMIDRTYPDRSLLAQYALHPDSAEIDHPAIKGQVYKPIALNKSAPGYVTLVRWMQELRAGEPKYGIKYDLPGGAKTKSADTGDASKPGAAKAAGPAVTPSGASQTQPPQNRQPVTPPPPGSSLRPPVQGGPAMNK